MSKKDSVLMDRMHKKIKGYAKHKRSKTCGRIYASNIPWDMKRHELIALFNKFTDVHSIYMNYTADKKFTGYCFVTVENMEEALKANETIVKGRPMHVRKATKNDRYIKRIKECAK